MINARPYYCKLISSFKSHDKDKASPIEEILRASFKIMIIGNRQRIMIIYTIICVRSEFKFLFI